MQAASYSAEKTTVSGIPVVRLTDEVHGVVVSVTPTMGNNAYEMKVKGKNIFWSPYESLAELKSKPTQVGNPFLAPWANRLDGDRYFVNGRQYNLNSELRNFRRDANQKPIHGLVVFAAQWEVVEIEASEHAAHVTSRLDFSRQPGWMAQFPFAHSYEMTYRLQDGMLEVETRIENLSAENLPVAIGYHPYFRVHDAPRDQWRVTLPVREHLTLSEQLIPTGETKPVNYSEPMGLAGKQLDDVFGALVRGESGRAEFTVQGKQQKVSVLFGPKYPIAVVYAPPDRDFVCFEPMSAPTNAFNLSYAGIYKELQVVPPGGIWKESFWVAPSGF